jgi:hypothetical protein
LFSIQNLALVDSFKSKCSIDHIDIDLLSLQCVKHSNTKKKHLFVAQILSQCSPCLVIRCKKSMLFYMVLSCIMHKKFFTSGSISLKKSYGRFQCQVKNSLHWTVQGKTNKLIGLAWISYGNLSTIFIFLLT